ncbi:MAG: MocR-like pyridoxine biosynthesis transcription factor PdxR [Lacisediminihabitans sp.]
MTHSSHYDAVAWYGEPSTFVDPDSTEPLYRQVRRFIESSIASGSFRQGRALPSSRYLSAVLGVSRNTVSVAYQELIALALIESRPRSGLYPAPVGQWVPAQPRSTQGPVSGVDWDRHLIAPPDTHLRHAQSRVDWASFPYPFIPGQPEPGRFPVRGWLRALADATSGPNIRQSIQDSVDTDDPLLVDAIIREILPSRGVTVDASNIIITNGAQQALSLLGETLLNSDSVVAVENPGYLDAAHIFARRGAVVAPIPVDSKGARVPSDSKHDILYLTPSHHHPTNVTLNLARRTTLLDKANRNDTLIIEDDYDSEVRFRGRPTPSLKSLDQNGRVIYVGTFSKFVAPGLRIGFIVADEPLIAALRTRRRYATKHPSGHIERALALFIESGEYHRALRHHRIHLKQKWELTSELLPQTLGWELPPPPAGGLSIWAEGPPEFCGTRVSELALQRGVLIDPGEHFFLTPDPPKNAVRIGFSAIPLEAIPAGLSQLAAAVREARLER